jgi:hypothetical protein
MAHPRICVAGIEAETRRHLRPTSGSERPLSRDLLAAAGGPFEIGAVVELGETTPVPNPPEVEDQRFEPAAARQIGRLKPEKYLGLLDEVAQRSIRYGFGPDLEHRGRYKFASETGGGECSLLCVRMEEFIALGISDWGTLQLRFNVAHERAYAPVTDLRFYEPDQRTIREAVVKDVAARLRKRTRAWVMFGLSRPWAPPEEDVERHWLQVNGICLEDDPLGPPPPEPPPPDPIRTQTPPRNCL